MTKSSFAKTDPIKLFASFNRSIFIPLVAPNNTPEIVHQRLKALGARIGKDSIQSLMDGTVDMVKDFEIVSVQDHHQAVKAQQEVTPRPPVTHTVATGTVVPPVQTTAPAVTPVPANVVVQQIPPQPAKQTSVRRGKARGLGYLPEKALVPLRRGTVYATMMEALKTGATIPELMLLSGNKTQGGANNLLSQQIKAKGYGVRYEPDSERYYLIFPRGISEIIYIP